MSICYCESQSDSNGVYSSTTLYTYLGAWLFGGSVGELIIPASYHRDLQVQHSWSDKTSNSGLVGHLVLKPGVCL